ncbi:MAG: hypothetical protein PVG83_13075 [Acidimicrobiia bacterium]|jgi:hypothetical protein
MRTLIWVVAAVISLTACSKAASAPPEPSELTVSHGCGYGFALGDEEQRVGLVLTFLDFEAATAGEVGSEFVLPDAVWDADLVFGYDLFSNWCDDVIEPDEPEVVIEKAFSVWGRLVIDQLPEAGTCGLASGTLLDASYMDDVDRRVELGDISLSNELWGCFAG